MRHWNSKTFIAAIFLALSTCMPMQFANAATAAEEARMAQCPEGAYAGPREGARRFMQDPYVWFVSREFAKRFCMPEQFVDDSLTGALAVAVRMKPDEEVTCGMYMGRSDQCPVNQKLLLEVYVDNRKANIPKADPSVKFFAGRGWNSAWYLGTGIPRMKKRYAGEDTEVEGERRPFSPVLSKTITKRENWTQFLYVAERKGWASIEGEFIEDYYRADWVEGMDLIVLDASYGFGLKRARNPDAPPNPKDPHYLEPVKKFAIAVMHGKDTAPFGNAWQANDWYKKNVAYPKGYLHVIELPHKVAQMIYAYDQQQGEQFFNDVKRAITQPPASVPATTTTPTSR